MHLTRGRMQIPTCSSAQKGFAVTQECGQAAWALEFLPACLLLCSKRGVYTAQLTGQCSLICIFHFMRRNSCAETVVILGRLREVCSRILNFLGNNVTRKNLMVDKGDSQKGSYQTKSA